MRRIELLINDVRFNTNNEGTNRYSSIRMIKFFNDAQRTLQALIHTHDTNGKYFVREVFLNLVANQESYAMPLDIFADNAITGVARLVTTSSIDYYTPMRQLTEKERRKEFGYIPQGATVLVSPVPNILLNLGLRINYTYRIATLSLRVGKIASKTDGVSVQLEAGFLADDITLFEDFFCVIGADGTIKDKEFALDGYNTGTGLISTSSTLVNGAVGDYVVIGAEATSHSELPNVCEQLLTNFVERKIHAVDSSKEISDINFLTQEEITSMKELFVDVEQDVKYPPIADDTYLNF